MSTFSEPENTSESKNVFRSLYHATPAIMHSIDANGDLIFVSDSWCQFLGYDRNEAIGRKSVEFLTESSRLYASSVAFPEFQKRGFIQNVPYEFVKKNGEVVDVALSASAARDADGRIIRAMAVLVDRSEQRKVEEQVGRKLLQLERLTKIATGLNRVFSELPEKQVHAGLVELIGDTFSAEYSGLGIANENGVYDCRLLERGEGISRFAIDPALVDGPFWKKLTQNRRAVVDGENVSLSEIEGSDFFALGLAMNEPDRPVGMVFLLNAEHPYSTDDFDLMERMLFLLAPMIRTRGELRRQRSQRREAERRIRIQQLALEHSSRLNAMGEMAGGLAHELNQPLTAIANFIDASKHKLIHVQDGSAAESSVLLDKAEEQVFRAASIVKNVRRFVSKSEPSRDVFNVNQLITETIDLMKTDVRLEAIEIEFTSTVEGLNVSADRLQIQQVLVNLLQNAVEAVEESSERRVEIRSNLDSKKMCIVAVEDSGPGFAEQNQSLLFSSMYTTKSRGLGMGLSICRTIIESHGGNMSAQNRDPRGAIFTFAIPASSL